MAEGPTQVIVAADADQFMLQFTTLTPDGVVRTELELSLDAAWLLHRDILDVLVQAAGKPGIKVRPPCAAQRARDVALELAVTAGHSGTAAHHIIASVAMNSEAAVCLVEQVSRILLLDPPDGSDG